MLGCSRDQYESRQPLHSSSQRGYGPGEQPPVPSPLSDFVLVSLRLDPLEHPLEEIRGSFSRFVLRKRIKINDLCVAVDLCKVPGNKEWTNKSPFLTSSPCCPIYFIGLQNESLTQGIHPSERHHLICSERNKVAQVRLPPLRSGFIVSFLASSRTIRLSLRRLVFINHYCEQCRDLPVCQRLSSQRGLRLRRRSQPKDDPQ